MSEICERCGETLKDDRVIWLELDRDTGLYHYEEQFPKTSISQGSFPFGKTCAEKQLEEQ